MASSPTWKCSGFLPGGGWSSLPGPQAWSWILGELWNLGVPKTRQLRWSRKSREMVWGCCRALKGWEQWGLHKKILVSQFVPINSPENPLVCRFPPVVPAQSSGITRRGFYFSQRNPHPQDHRAALTTHFKLNFPPCQSAGSKSLSPSQRAFPSPSAEGIFVSFWFCCCCFHFVWGFLLVCRNPTRFQATGNLPQQCNFCLKQGKSSWKS